MRPRNRNDWTTDLAGRRQLETTVAATIEQTPGLRLVTNATDSFDHLDYTIQTGGGVTAAVELKAKWQPYTARWQQHRPDVPEPDLFILDELALRKIVTAGHCSHLLIYDHPCARWAIYGMVDLVLAPKVRIARQLNRNRRTIKGKLLLNLSDAHNAGSRLADALRDLARLVDNTHRRWTQVEPWPTPNQEAS